MLDLDQHKKTDQVPLRLDKNGAVRVGETEGTLDVIVGAYDRGATAPPTCRRSRSGRACAPAPREARGRRRGDGSAGRRAGPLAVEAHVPELDAAGREAQRAGGDFDRHFRRLRGEVREKAAVEQDALLLRVSSRPPNRSRAASPRRVIDAGPSTEVFTSRPSKAMERREGPRRKPQPLPATSAATAKARILSCMFDLSCPRA
jgi:hypothetical protein